MISTTRAALGLLGALTIVTVATTVIRTGGAVGARLDAVTMIAIARESPGEMSDETTDGMPAMVRVLC